MLRVVYFTLNFCFIFLHKLSKISPGSAGHDFFKMKTHFLYIKVIYVLAAPFCSFSLYTPATIQASQYYALYESGLYLNLPCFSRYKVFEIWRLLNGTELDKRKQFQKTCQRSCLIQRMCTLVILIAASKTYAKGLLGFEKNVVDQEKK